MGVTVIPKKTVTLIEPARSLVVDKQKYRQKRVAAYCRVSTDSDEQLTSYNNQMKVYTEMIAENHDWEFAGMYADEGISGTRADKRPQFTKMISDCLNGKIDMIITKSVSRFARNTVECLEYVRMLKARGIGIIFEEQNIDTLKTDSELYLVIYAGFAQSESESMSKNITWAFRKNFENGKSGFVYKSFLGYRRGDDGQPEIVPEEAEAVRSIFSMFLSGKTHRQISEEMQRRNYKFEDKEFQFSVGQISSILRNEKYTGDLILQKTVTIDCITKTRKRNNGEAPMYLVQNNHPAIISREIFNKAQEEFAKRNAITPKSKKTSVTYTGRYSRYALSDVLICGECGSRFRRCTWTRSGYKKIVWRCMNRLDYGTKYCPESETVEEKTLQDAIVRALRKFSDEDVKTYIALMRATIGDALGINGSNDEIELLERRIETLNKRILDMVSGSVKDGGSFESCENEFKDLNEQIIQLKSRIDVMKQRMASDTEYKTKLKQIDRVIDERESRADVYDDSIVRQMIECIKVFPGGRLEVYFGGGYMIEENLHRECDLPKAL